MHFYVLVMRIYCVYMYIIYLVVCCVSFYCYQHTCIKQILSNADLCTVESFHNGYPWIGIKVTAVESGRY